MTGLRGTPAPQRGSEPGAELVAALFDGVSEKPLWATFLSRLRRATRADFAILTFRPPGRRLTEALNLMSGNAPLSAVDDVHQRHHASMEPPRGQTLIEGRPYSLDELFADDGSSAVFNRRLVAFYGVTAVRQMRVQEASGVDAWLTITRSAGDFTPEDSALLAGIAPILRGPRPPPRSG